MPKKKQTLDTVQAEQERLLARQAELETLLGDEDTPLDTITELVQEQQKNAATLNVLEPRLAKLRAERERDDYEARQDAIRQLRTQEKAAFLDVVDGAGIMWKRLLSLEAVYRELAQLGAHPLTGIPRELCQMIRPGLSGGLHHWAQTVKRIR